MAKVPSCKDEFKFLVLPCKPHKILKALLFVVLSIKVILATVYPHYTSRVQPPQPRDTRNLQQALQPDSL